MQLEGIFNYFVMLIIYFINVTVNFVKP